MNLLFTQFHHQRTILFVLVQYIFLPKILHLHVAFFLTFAEDNIDNILKQTDETLKAGDHSLYNIDKHINPFEYMCSCVGICPTNITSGLSIG